MNIEKNLKTLLTVSIFLVVLASPASARTFFISHGDSIQTAINNAADEGDEIRVAPGTYNEVIDFKGKAVRLYSSDGPEVTTIDATGVSGNYHVVKCIDSEDPNTILEGFTITGGVAKTFPETDGGGMYNDGASPTVTNCIFFDNDAVFGGGMSNWASSPTVTGCTFTSNGAFYGGGMGNYNSNPNVINCTFSDNLGVGVGGGMYNVGSSSPTVTHCIFNGNSTTSAAEGRGGGGMCNYSGTTPQVYNCIFTGNTTNYNGGGIANYDGSTPQVYNCIFTGNTSVQDGGGIYNNASWPTIINCTFSGNEATVNGGGMYLEESGVIATNCTFYGNSAGNKGGATFGVHSSLDLRSCIVWGNWGAPQVFDYYSHTDIYYSDVQNDNCSGDDEYNISSDPLFVDADGDDDIVGTEDDNLRLQTGSPCIDTGDPSITDPEATDLAGNPRIIDADSVGGARVDMGAYEVGPVHNVTQNKYYNIIQNAIDNAVDYDQIKVGPGTYYETIDFGSINLRLYSSDGAEATTIDGTGYDHVVQCVGGQDANTILEGFTITGGNANGGGDDSNGGGMLISSSSPTVTNCIFRDNSGQNGGGMYIASCDSIVTNCIFIDNSSSLGGGIFSYSSINPIITNCTFSINSSLTGGGIYNSYSYPMITNCTFNGNSSESGTYGGGGMVDYYSSSTVINCTFTGNSAVNIGGGMYNWGSTTTLTNCILWDNTAVSGGNEIALHTSSININYSDVQGGEPGIFNDGTGNTINWGLGSIDADPLFINSAGGDYRLVTPCSPCVDSGNNSVPNLPATDKQGNPRIQDGNMDSFDVVDMGAFELNILFRVHNITRDCWYQKIQHGIDDAGNDEVLVMEAGTFYEAINFNGKAITLQSMDPYDPNVIASTIIDATGLNLPVITCDSGEGPDTVILGLTITGGMSNNKGGGMYNFNSNPTVVNCVLCNNSSKYGGGMFNEDSPYPVVTHCTFKDNTGKYGGGMYNLRSDPTVINSILWNNSVNRDGGGMYNDDSFPIVTNCTFTGNNTTGTGCGMYNFDSDPNVTNGIFWRNWGSSEQIYDEGIFTASISFSNLTGSWPGGIFFDPVFVDAASGDFSLCWSSLCIDSGNNGASALPETDMAGNPRIANGVVDMGVLESEPRVSSTALQVNVTPQEAIDQEARWRVDSGDWLDPNDIFYGLEPGYHDVDFEHISGWTEPETLPVRVIGDTLVYKTAEYKPLLTFAIGEIPSRDVYHGDTLMFNVEADWLADPNFQIVGITNEPAGSYSLDSVTGLFTYEPDDISDCTPFEITIRVTSGDGLIEEVQIVKITPVPDLPLEYTLFTDPVLDIPDPNSLDYIFINEINSDSNQRLNGMDRPVSSIIIIGKTIIISANHPHVYTYHDDYHISDLTIYAETVIVRDPLRLRQTDVTIYAKQLSFEGTESEINTIPENEGSQAEGLNGGDINLFIESLDVGPGTNQRFKTSGVPGDDGWPGYSGAINCTRDAQQPFAWLSPYALKMVIAHAKDAYLYKYNVEAHAILTEYQNLLNIYTGLPDYDSLEPQWRFEFNQMHQEIINLVHRLENGLDYFGNPPGWTPMLSYEVWSLTYADEIDRSIRILYLSYWLQNVSDDINAKANALQEGREKLWSQTEQFRSDYENLKDNVLPGLITRASVIDDTIGRADYGGCSGLLCKLKNKEAELLSRADLNVEEIYKVPDWKRGLNFCATIATGTITGASTGGPGGAILGNVGGYISATNDLLSSDDAWKSASATTDVTRQFNIISGEFKDAIDESSVVFSSINTLGDIETNANTYLQNLEGSAKQIADGMHAVKEALRTTSLDNKEVEAELNRIKAADSTFNYLVDQVTELTVSKEIFNRELAAAMQKVSALSNGINNNILAIDAINRQASNNILDPRVIMYVKDMENRAKARLLKYHYYVSKSYEYRMLKPYPLALNTETYFNHIKNMADSDPNHYLNSTQFDSLKSIYDEQLLGTRDDILEDMEVANEKSIRLNYLISSSKRTKERAQLNAGLEPPITFAMNLSDLPIDLERENIRIVDMLVEDVADVIIVSDPPYEFPGETTCAEANVAIKMEHSGVCNLQQGAETYRFTYPEGAGKINWGNDCFGNGDVENSTSSQASESMLRSLIPGLNNDDVLFYSRPALLSDISMRGNLNGAGDLYDCADIDVEFLLLKIKYDYFNRVGGYVTLRVRTAPEELQPYFTVDTPDESEAERKDGIGEFYRTYTPNAPRFVTVTAPERYGEYEFKEWVNRNDGKDPDDPVLDFDTAGLGNRLYIVKAEYNYNELVGDINADLNVNLLDFSVIAAAWTSVLGDPQWDAYCDISDPEDYTIDLQDIIVLCNNWLATTAP